ncbi:MAG: bifunctional phosphoribosylaminoimidazolecarboxamide formyltransferase/IMP cyclohydrolase, partial [Synergistaceae bacterium]|nr:bifunctional phosphoribosylaminoimidazolecarboxamide formyltransferase/IMP cyclohydrolase [Synergistaceae bacterium]
PFEETARRNAGREELIEKIDIGGVSLIRAAAKNFARVAVITDPADYEPLMRAVKNGGLSESFRRDLAIKAFLATSLYDATIHEGLKDALGYSGGDEDEITLPLRKAQKLRYGENPWQRASLYMPTLAGAPFTQHSGKELSYNNLLDLDALLNSGAIFRDANACVIVKHTTPCGVAEAAAGAEDETEAYRRALACDPTSAFGGIVGFTGRVGLRLARLIAEHFYEILAAPEITPEAIEFLKSAKPNLRVLTLTGGYTPRTRVTGNRTGFLVQSETLPTPPSPGDGKWVGTPRGDLWDDLVFAWKVACLAKSNAIVLASGGASVGIGSGFTNRVDAAEYAVKMARDKARGAVMASDAFFPFPDTVELAAAAGVAAIIQPGGSIRDREVEARALELGVSMFVGGVRTFRH